MKKFISMLLVIAMMITVLTVGIATTSAAETATITIYGFDGTTEVKEISVGDEFTVYTTLNAASVNGGKIGSIQGVQTYSNNVISLVDEVSGQYGEFTDLVKVFPVTGEATMANGATAGKITYNASAPTAAQAFAFDSDHSQVIVTTYKVTAAGNGEVKNTIKNLAASDSAMTKIVYEGTTEEGKSYTGKAYFEDPTPEIDHAEVRLHSLDGRVETKSFRIGDTFTVYTMLNASSVNGGKMGSINGVQKFTASVLELTDTVADDYITNTTKVFPVMKDNAIASVKTAGAIKYAGSSSDGFDFNSSASYLIVTSYKVTANGYADITNKLNVLAAADEDITRIVFNGELQSGMSYSMPASFTAEVPIPTEPVTEPATKLKVTIVNPDNTTEVKEFNVGDTFTVYTTLNVNAKIANVDGSQTYPAAALQLTDAVTGTYSEVSNKTAMFPVLGDEVTATAKNGTIKFNASRAAINNGFAFNADDAKLIVTNYKVLQTGEATIKTTLKTLVKDDAAVTKIVWNGAAQSGQSYTMKGSFTDPSQPATEPVTEPATEPATEPVTEPVTEPATEPVVPKAKVTIIGIDGTSQVKEFAVGESFTVYTTFNASKATANAQVASISGTQTYTSSVLKSDDAVDTYDVIIDNDTVFPILKDKAVAKSTAGLIKFNGSTAQIGKGFKFDSDAALLIVTKYTVKAARDAVVKTAITTLAADTADLTRIVDEGKIVNPGSEIGGIASFTDPTQPDVPTEPVTEPVGETYLLGDANDDGFVDTTDATFIQRYDLGSSMPSWLSEEILERNGDVNGDGFADTTDATFIQRYDLGIAIPSKYRIGEYVSIH